MKILACSTVIHPYEYEFPSVSEPGMIHTTVSSSLFNEAFCTCPGWHFNLGCSHVDTVEKLHCAFCVPIGTTGFEEMSPCPECGHPLEIFETNGEYI